MSAFISALNVTPLADGQQWRLNAPFAYRSGAIGRLLIVPARFQTDFASIPKVIRNVLPAWNKYGPAAVVHDYLYWIQETPRATADNILLEAMRALGVDDVLCTVIYDGVRAGGQPSWDNNAELKASGYTRQASLEDLPPYAAITRSRQ